MHIYHELTYYLVDNDTISLRSSRIIHQLVVNLHSSILGHFKLGVGIAP